MKNKLPTILRFSAAFALTIAFYCLGTVLKLKLPESGLDIISAVFFVCFALFFVLLAVNYFGSRQYNKRKNGAGVQEIQQYFMDRRSEAVTELHKALGRVHRLRILFSCYSVLIFVIAAVICIGFSISDLSGAAIFPLYIFYGLCCRIHPLEKPDFSNCADPSDYPRLHALAHKAADELGIRGDIRIFLTGRCNAGIGKIRKTYTLEIGVILLDILSEDELYQVLLHEFAHMASDSCSTEAEERLFRFISDDTDESSLSMYVNLLFLLPEAVFGFEYYTYLAAASIAFEEIADKSVIDHGNTKLMANALAKLYYYDLFDADNLISEHYYAPEEMRRDVVSFLCRAFRQAVPAHEAQWHRMMENEIEPRNASHPILRNRLASIGESDFTVIFPDSTGEYRAECARALDEVNTLIYENSKDDYARLREENYLRPLRIVEDWKARGEPLKDEENRTVLDALSSLCRFEELEALCDRIISGSANMNATALARFYKARLLMERYDRGGISLMYEAMEINTDFIEPGLDIIGTFCCRMGLSEELEDYRRKAVELVQLQRDKYSQGDSLEPSDRLAEEMLPAEIKSEIINFILNVGEDKICRIYTLRKLVDDELFYCPFVIEFDPDADGETIGRIMQRIFDYLDTRPEEAHYTLFVYAGGPAAAADKVKNSCIYNKYA